MKNSLLDWLAVVFVLLLLGQGGRSLAGANSARTLCAQPKPTLPMSVRAFCSWLYSTDPQLVRRVPAQQFYKLTRDDDDGDLEPMEQPVNAHQERFLQEPTGWETIKRQDNNHMFLRFGRRRK